MMKTRLSPRISSAMVVVGPLAPSQRMLAADAVGVAAGDDVFGRRGDEDLAVVGEEFVLVGGLGLGEAVDGAGALAVFDEGGDVDAVLVVEAAVVLGDADDGVALFVKELR